MTPEHATPHRSKLLESNDPENGRCDEKPNVVRPHEFHFLRCRTRDFVHKVATQSHFQLVCQFARINRTGLFAVLPDFRHSNQRGRKLLAWILPATQPRVWLSRLKDSHQNLDLRRWFLMEIHQSADLLKRLLDALPKRRQSGVDSSRLSSFS